MLVELQNTQLNYSDDKNIQELFEAQVERTPDAIAVVFQDQELSYRELNKRANAVAHYLRKLGVGPECLVGLCMARSLEMIVGLLGTLKAGGAFVPLDPAYPTERLDFMLHDCDAGVLLTQRRLAGVLSNNRTHLVCLDSDWEAIIEQSGENPLHQTTAENLAYVIYTSGSTGQPKGVLISHGSLAIHCVDVQRCYGLHERDRVLQFASLSVDASIEQILPPLIIGARLVLRGAAVWSPAELLNNILYSKLTIIDLPTAYWHEVAQAWAHTSQVISSGELRLVIVGGDAMSAKALKLWQQTPMNGVRLLNAYGPTEATITSTIFEITRLHSVDTATPMIPIGRTIGNRKTYILDENGNPVPVGIPGELHIGGNYLARGYLNRPELTAEKFIANPFTDEAGTYLYRTGDLARYLKDGDIEFLGRLDSQVKIRGFRVELSAIENVLTHHLGVREAVVIVRETSPGDKRLIAYVVPSSTQILTRKDLQNLLKSKLPEHMLPSAFVFMDYLPLGPNGKLNREALPVPDQRRPEVEQVFVAPRTPTEEVLSAIWQEILGLEAVGIRDDFFELGGDSLLGAQLFAQLEERLNVSLSLATLFQAPTIEELAMFIQGEQLRARSAIVIRPDGGLPQEREGHTAIHAKGKTPPLFWVLPYFVQSRVIKGFGRDQRVYGLHEIKKSPNRMPLTLEQLASNYIETIRQLQPHGPYALAGYCIAAAIAHEIARQLFVQGETVEPLIMIDPLDPAESEGDFIPDPLGFRLRFAMNRAMFHLQKTKGYSLRHKMSYLLDSMDQVHKRVADRINQHIYRACVDASKPLPDRLQDGYHSSVQAFINSVPKPYPGFAILVRPAIKPKNAYDYANRRWAQLTPGGLDIHEVPGDGYSMWQSPNAEKLSQKISLFCLRYAKP